MRARMVTQKYVVLHDGKKIILDPATNFGAKALQVASETKIQSERILLVS